MRRYEVEKKAIEKYGEYRLYYEVVSESYMAESNAENIERMKDALDAVGVWLDVEDGVLRLAIYPERYVRIKDRNAGRRKAAAWKQNASKNGKYEFYYYSDIVFMLQTMKDKDIADKIGMPIATFYRHKKTLRESEYYQSLDLNRLKEKEYLESVADNQIF